MEEFFRQLLDGASGAATQFENPGRTADGREKVISWQNMVLEDANGAMVGVLSTGIEVIHRNRAERPILGSEQWYSELYDNLPIGMYRTTPDGIILLANAALVRMLGYDSFGEMKTRNLEGIGYEATYSRAEFKERLEEEGEVIGYEAPWRISRN